MAKRFGFQNKGDQGRASIYSKIFACTLDRKKFFLVSSAMGGVEIQAKEKNYKNVQVPQFSEIHYR